jgi:hypothetical protein
MTDDIEQLLAFGRIGLETGYYEQARGYFEQVLALDPSNREAMKGLARVNEILSRREAPGVEVIQGEPVEPPLKPEIQPTEHKAEPPTQRFQEMIKRFARLFGTLAVIGGLLFVLLLPLGILIDADILGYLAIAGFYAALFFGVLWFACWALGKLWK